MSTPKTVAALAAIQAQWASLHATMLRRRLKAFTDGLVGSLEWEVAIIELSGGRACLEVAPDVYESLRACEGWDIPLLNYVPPPRSRGGR